MENHDKEFCMSTQRMGMSKITNWALSVAQDRMRSEPEQAIFWVPNTKMNLSDWLCKTKVHKIPYFL